MQRWWQIRLKQSRDGFEGGARNWKSICTLAQMRRKKRKISDTYYHGETIRAAGLFALRSLRLGRSSGLHPRCLYLWPEKWPEGVERTQLRNCWQKTVIAFSPPEVKDKRERAATPQSWRNFAGTGQKLRDPSLGFLSFLFFFFFRMCREIPKLEHMQNEFVPSGASPRGILRDLRRRRLRAITEPVGRARVKEVIIPTLIGVVWVSSARLCRRLWLLQTKHFGHLFRS